MGEAEPTTPEYEAQRMAEVIAECVSGVKGAVPEPKDHRLAGEMLLWIDTVIANEED